MFVCDSLSRALSTRVDEPATDTARSDVGALFTEHWRVVPHRVCCLAHRYSSEEKGLMAEVEAEVHVLHAEDHFDEYLLKRWIDVFGMEGVFRNKVGRHAPCAVARFVCVGRNSCNAPLQLATLKTRKLEGRLGVTLQTDPGQVQGKRQNPAHKAVYIPVYQEFNPAAFNFAKAKPVETLFRLDFPPKPRGDNDGEAKSDAGPPPHAVLANISPLMICHSLLCLYGCRAFLSQRFDLTTEVAAAGTSMKAFPRSSAQICWSLASSFLA